MKQTFVVTQEDRGLSLLQYLQRQLPFSGKAIKRSIEASGCFVNDLLERFASRKLKGGDHIAFEMAEKKPQLTKKFEDPYFTLWEKDSGFICDKRCELHRLDKETSGLIMTSDETEFYDLFRDREIEKYYLALVEGRVFSKKGKVEEPIALLRREKGQKFMSVSEEGDYALTKWEVLKQGTDRTLLRCQIITGKTHQIRVHLAHIGHPVVGDYRYDPTQERQAKRMMLHASELKFTHPITRKPMRFHSKEPKEFHAHLSR